MNDTISFVPKPIPRRVLKFLGEWLASTATLFIDPTNALRVYKTEAQISACIKRDVAFSASCLFVSSLLYLIVLLRTEFQLSSYATQITSMSVLILVFWIIYALILAGVIKMMGGIVDFRINVSFCVRILATFYLIATALSTIAFLSSGDLKVVFDIATIILRVVLPVMFMPMVFWKPNGLVGQKRAGLYGIIIAMAVINAVLDSRMLFVSAPSIPIILRLPKPNSQHMFPMPAPCIGPNC
jgi:hypothetical protein